MDDMQKIKEYEQILKRKHQLFAFMRDALLLDKEDIIKCTDAIMELNASRNE